MRCLFQLQEMPADLIMSGAGGISLSLCGKFIDVIIDVLLLQDYDSMIEYTVLANIATESAEHCSIDKVQSSVCTRNDHFNVL